MSANITTVGTTVATTIATHSQNVTVSTTLDPFNNRTTPFYNNNSTHGFNNSIPIPCCPIQYPTIQYPTAPTIVTYDDFWYWDEIYYFYVIMLLLICFGVGYGSYIRHKRLAEQKQRARLRAQGSGNACTPPANGNCTDNVAPRCDNPPTYETAMANYIDAKQQLRQMEEGAVAGAMAMSASTTTIETCISDVGQSRTDLRPNTTEDVTATGSVVFNTTNETTKPPL
ncbi:uncharacterized protein LOC105216039 isoform X1 [Zeugodacus cucurbitae]|uniref:Uncharacterized protein n=1 Tax=Zeugodacus cucurbitae TaxID=28588 RepID=A0A0A1XFP1_ZEUCU|nr:uncharacterized protein LOC105216039 isoform X1 [Zeugodacus cucurbitae]